MKVCHFYPWLLALFCFVFLFLKELDDLTPVFLMFLADLLYNENSANMHLMVMYIKRCLQSAG